MHTLALSLRSYLRNNSELIQQKIINRDYKMDKKNQQALLDISTWKRIAYTIFFFVFAYSIAKVVASALIIGQILIKLVTGEVNQKILAFSKLTADYMYDIVLYATFNSNKKPFPFTDMPN